MTWRVLIRDMSTQNINASFSDDFLKIFLYIFSIFQEKVALEIPNSLLLKNLLGIMSASFVQCAKNQWLEKVKIFSCCCFFFSLFLNFFLGFIQDEGNIICPECARKKMLEEMEAESQD